VRNVTDIYFLGGLGSLAELLGDPEEASTAYQHALRANPRSIPAMNGMSSILRAANQWAKAIEYLQSVLKLEGNNGEVWGSLGKYLNLSRHCASNIV
jgi:general transcriptional corepressor CYC8